MLNRAARAWVTPVIAVLVLILAGDATAGALKTTVRKFCANTSLRIPDGPESGDFVSRLVKTGKCPPRLLCGYGGLPLGAKVLDVDASVRVTHPAISDLNVLLANPTGGLTTLTARNAGGADFGSGAVGCTGTLTIFDDAAPAAIELASPALAPFAGRFRPRQALRGHDGTFGSGDWRFYFDDVVAGNAGTVNAIGIKLKYRYVVRRP